MTALYLLTSTTTLQHVSFNHGFQWEVKIITLRWSNIYTKDVKYLNYNSKFSRFNSLS